MVLSLGGNDDSKQTSNSPETDVERFTVGDDGDDDVIVFVGAQAHRLLP